MFWVILWWRINSKPLSTIKTRCQLHRQERVHLLPELGNHLRGAELLTKHAGGNEETPGSLHPVGQEAAGPGLMQTEGKREAVSKALHWGE